MEKKGAINRAWKRRWFVLKEDKLRYFDSPNDINESGSINLVKASILRSSEGEGKSNRPHGITITTNARTYFLDPGTSFLHEEWFSAIQASISSLSQNRKNLVKVGAVQVSEGQESIHLLQQDGSNLWCASFLWIYVLDSVTFKVKEKLRLSKNENNNSIVKSILCYLDFIWICSSKAISRFTRFTFSRVDCIPIESEVSSFVFHPSTNTFWSSASLLGESKLVLWSPEGKIVEEVFLKEEKEEKEEKSEEKAQGLILLVVDQMIWCGFSDGSISILDVETKKVIKRLCQHKQKITSMLLLWNRSIWTSSLDISICIWN